MTRSGWGPVSVEGIAHRPNSAVARSVTIAGRLEWLKINGDTAATTSVAHVENFLLSTWALFGISLKVVSASPKFLYTKHMVDGRSRNG